MRLVELQTHTHISNGFFAFEVYRDIDLFILIGNKKYGLVLKHLVLVDVIGLIWRNLDLTASTVGLLSRVDIFHWDGEGLLCWNTSSGPRVNHWARMNFDPNHSNQLTFIGIRVDEKIHRLNGHCFASLAWYRVQGVLFLVIYLLVFHFYDAKFALGVW